MIWFEKLREHGPLPSSFLLAYCRHQRASEKRSRERLTDLFNEDNTPDGGTYLVRPPQQFATIDSRYNQLVYDLSPAAHKALARVGSPSLIARRVAGPWLHAHMVACVTASVELATLARADVSYIPQSAILARAEAELQHQVRFVDPACQRPIEKALIPDALFGLEYQTAGGKRYRFFAVECDRATEPLTSANWNRKSFVRSVRQYQAYIGGGIYRTHLNLTAPLLLLTVTSNRTRCQRMIDWIARHDVAGSEMMLFQYWPDFGSPFRPPPPNFDLLQAPWQRGGKSPFLIETV